MDLRRRPLWVGVAVLALSCGPAPGPAPADGTEGPKPGGVLNVRTTLDPFNWDIHASRTVPNSWGVALAYSSLLAWKMGPEVEYGEMVLQPELADRWEVSPDARSFTFHLRKGVKFQNLPPVNGRELTSDDVKFSAEYGGRTGEFKEKGLPVGEQNYIWEGLVLPQEATVFAGFQARQLDLIHQGQDAKEAQEVRRNNPQALSYKWLDARHPEMWLSQLPARNSPVRDVRVRRAVSLSIDQDEINRTLFGGEAELGLPGATPGLFTQTEARGLYKHDPAEARRLVAEAGYPTGLALEWFIAQDVDQTRISLAELIQAQLKRAGVDLQLKFVERTEQRRIRRSFNFDIDMDSIGRLHDDPDSQVMAHYYGPSRGNYSQIRDPQLDRLLEASRRELDPEKRRDLLRSVTRHLVDHVYAIRMLAGPQWAFWHSYVQNYRPHFGSRADYAFVWLAK